MSFRRKLLAVFAITVFLSVAAVTWIVSSITRRGFERLNEERTTALIAQFRREYKRRGEEVARRVESVAASDAASQIALALSRGPRDYSQYVGTAKNLAESQQLDFLEFVDGDGTIISSAQWPAKFGYKDSSVAVGRPVVDRAFLKQEELPDSTVLALVSERELRLGDSPLFVIGGTRVDKDFLASMELPSGMRVMLYQNSDTTFSAQALVASEAVQNSALLAPLVGKVEQEKQETTETVHWSQDAADDEVVHAIPLAGPDKQLIAVLLIGNSQRPYVEVSRHIRSAALLVGSAGIVLAILFSGWAAARVTRPVEQLVEAARDVAAGDWSTQVPVSSTDEIGELAEAFNRMTHEMVDQKEQLVQSERVAAWRELARRLAHELKNPLFPLQLTVENLVRARELPAEQFDEVFRESSSTLLAEVANLKNIISRFSEFSRMPQPQFQRVNVNDIVQNVVRLFQAQLQSAKARIACKVELADASSAIAADPDLLHRAVSNLVLNAMDAMPQGGTITLATRRQDNRASIEVSDTGTGLTSEECERLFTPYYTNKEHGTGLGLAIVQSIVSDHGGKISVRSQPGRGATFIIDLPSNLEKLRAAESASTTI
jgi:two-component system, NtrC family, nitrogen regulation sensor histidine kinase NtrY